MSFQTGADIFGYTMAIVSAMLFGGMITTLIFTLKAPHFIDRTAAYWGGYWSALIKHTGLSARDGSLSHTKVFGYAVLGVYLMGTSLPSGVAITLIISAHGTKALMAWINKGSLTVAARDEFQAKLIKEEIHTIDERKGWVEGQDFQES